MRPQTISITGVGQTAWIPVDYTQDPVNISLHAEPAGNTVTIEYTVDDVMAGATAVAYPVTGMSGVTANTAGNVAFPIQAVRINQTLGAGTSVLKILQSRR
jgi:hypothetical protein